MVPEDQDDDGKFVDLLPSEVQLGCYVAIDDDVVVAGQLSGDKVINDALGVAEEMSDKEDLCDAVLRAGRTAKAAVDAFAVFGRILVMMHHAILLALPSVNQHYRLLHKVNVRIKEL